MESLEKLTRSITLETLVEKYHTMELHDIDLDYYL